MSKYVKPNESGLFDKAMRLEELHQMDDPLARLDEVIDWSLFDEEAGEWLTAQPAVQELRIAGAQVIFGFRGSDEAQADLLAGLFQLGIRIRAFEERRSSFEDILVEVAETNRHV